MKHTRPTAIATASYVTAFSVAERALGFLYRIVLSRLIGAEGLGIYQVALALFAVFLTFGTGGIPISVSRFISRYKAENNLQKAEKSVSAGIICSLCFTLPILVFFQLFAQKCGFLFSDPRCIPTFKILLWGLVFSALYAVLRGHYWGNKQFFLPALLDIAEEAVMVIVGVLLLQNVADPLQGAQGAAWAVIISYLFSFTALSVGFFVQGGKLHRPQGLVKPLFGAAMPITAVRLGATLTNSAVAILLPAMLIRAGYSNADALTTLGVVSGMAIPILMIPATVISSLSLVLTPTLSEDYYGKNRARLYKNLKKGLKFAFYTACFFLPFFAVLGEDCGRLAFSNALAGEMIMKACPMILPMCLAMLSTSMLNAIGFEKNTFLYHFIGESFFLACILFLPKYLGGYAYIVGLGGSFLICAACNLALLAKHCPSLFSSKENDGFKRELCALACALPASVAGKTFLTLFNRLFGVTLSLFFTGVATALFLLGFWFVCGIFPKGSKINLRLKAQKEK